MRSPFKNTSELNCFADAYLKRNARGFDGTSKEADQIAALAGERIRTGERTKKNLDQIFHWKNASSQYYRKLKKDFDTNSPAHIKEVLSRVADAGTNAEALSALLTLKGVKVPTASAILANIYPEQFTVIDRLALRALGINNQDVAFYLLYNGECSKIAKRHKVSLRMLDRALWEWGKRRGKIKCKH